MPPVYNGQLGPEPRDPNQRFWDPDVQMLHRAQLRALQTERLRTMVAKILTGAAPLFGTKLAEVDLQHPEDIRTPEDVSFIPRTVKQDLRDSEAAHPPFGTYRFTDPPACVRVGTSTGTTGTPTLSLWTRKDIWIEYESGARNWWRNGWRPGQIVTHAHPGYLYGGGALLSGALEYFGMLNVWVAPPDTDELAVKGLEMWGRVRPDVSMVAFSLGRFVEVAAKRDTEPNLPAFQFHGSTARGLPLMTAGLECYAYLGGPGPECVGAHLHEDWAIVQAVDPRTGHEVPDGEWGHLVVTTLDRDNGVLRYDLDEAACLLREPCPCGETSIRGLWGGRFQDLLAVQGKHVQVNEIEASLRTVERITVPTLEYMVVRPSDESAPLRVRVELGSGDSDGDRATIATSCARAIETQLGVRAEIDVVDRDTLARSGYKAVRLVES